MNLSGQVLDSSVVSRGIESTSLVRARQEIRRASLRKSAHGFSYQAGDLESDYTPPAVDGTGTGHVHTDYNLDRQVSLVAADGIPAATLPTYDAVKGRLTSLAFSGGTDTFGYDPASGRVSSIATADGITLSYAYDGPLLKTTTWAGPVAGSVTRTYDADFRLATETDAGGSPVTFQYDNDGLLTAAGALTITRDPATGFVTGSTLGGTTETRTYNSYGEEQSYTVKFGTTVLYSVDYGPRDALGRIVTKTETIQGETHTYVYGYDSRNRLSDVSKDGVAVSHYDYDANGTRLAAPNITASPVYDAQDRLTSYGSCTYGYKPDGS